MAKIRCKSCGKFIDETLCPHCGHHNYNGSTVSQTTINHTPKMDDTEPIVIIRKNQDSGESERIIINNNQHEDNSNQTTTNYSSSTHINDKKIYVALSLILSIMSIVGVFPIMGAIVSISLANKYKKTGDTEYLKYTAISKVIAILHLAIVGVTAAMTLIPLGIELFNALQ